MAVNKYLSITTLNVNRLNAPIKRHRVAEWIRKHDLHICCLQDPPQNKRSTQTVSEGMEKIFQANRHENKARVAILISDKIDFKMRAIKRDP